MILGSLPIAVHDGLCGFLWLLFLEFSTVKISISYTITERAAKLNPLSRSSVDSDA